MAMAIAVGEWTRGPVIGRGSSATVSLAVDHRTGAVFAVKSVGAARACELRREQNILRGLSSRHVLRCLGGSGPFDLFLEYAPGGSLADEIKRLGGRCDEGVIRARARDVLRGLAHVHAAGVAHCDVKARNVLIGADGRAMVADFGCARLVGLDKPRGGTPMFMAPEAARGEEQGTAADIWALGCVVIEMATGGAPWPRFADPMAALRHVGLSGEVPDFPQWFSKEGKDFLARCFQRDPRERWTAKQLLEHNFVAVGATTTSSSNSIPILSPKSVLDQGLWDDSTPDTAAATTTAPTDRLRSLAAGAVGGPDWTWDASWITVHDGDVSGNDGEQSMPPELEADSGSSDNSRGGSSAAASVSGTEGSAASSEGDEASRSCHASHAGHGNFYYGDAIGSCSGEPSDSFFG
ncbi:Mitogen-activated protein kinase kinase kinase A, partial [Dichanthelium oligosanthes]